MLGSLIKKVKSSLQRDKKNRPLSDQSHQPKSKPGQKFKSHSAERGASSYENKKNRHRKKHSHSKPKKSQQRENPWTLDDFRVEEVEGKTRFHDFNLNEQLMHGIAEQKFQYCSPIQAMSLPHALNGEDILGKAQTGTGKTAAFLISIIEQILRRSQNQERYASEPLALVLAPTRELVLQIAKDAKALTKYTSVNVMTVVGGMDFQRQQEALRHEIVDILVATPGRLLDFLNKRDVFLDQIQILVIDEADRMLDMGFIPDVRRIIQQTSAKEDRQTFFIQCNI